MNRLWIKFIINILLVFILTVKLTKSNVIRVEDDDEEINKGLYNASDSVVVLHKRNFLAQIFNKENAWIVQFYNSWCGHCRRFAPIYKDTARSIIGWRDIVNIGAIDCVNDDNNALCREYEIMHYPVIRYFSPNFKKGRFGIELNKGKDEESMRHIIITQLQKDQQEGNGDKWPNLIPYRGSELQDIWKGVPKIIKYKFYLFEGNNSFVGSEVILDLHNQSDIVIRRVISHSTLTMMYKIKQIPSLIVFDRQGSQTNLKITVPTRMGVIEVIKDFMKSKGVIIDSRVMSTPRQNNENNNGQNDRSVKFSSTKDDNLYQADLESTVRYSLEHEIPQKKILDGENFKILKEYLTVLALYFPLEHGNSGYFSAIRDNLETKTMIKGEEFSALVNLTEKKMAPVWTEKKQWINCRGSDPQYRGYPCGLWTLFHTLTVAFAMADKEDNPVDEPKKILIVMYNYITKFFGCSDCSEHFATMAEQEKLFNVKTTDEAVLWLWRAHNLVNKRLAGDLTEDPESPKIQYPSKEQCAHCKGENDTWNEKEVLTYLKKKYGISGIKYDTELKRERLYENGLQAMENNATDHHKTGWDFTIFDISICVVLYIVSATILVLVCIQFVVKRSLKKKTNSHNSQNFLRKV